MYLPSRVSLGGGDPAPSGESDPSPELPISRRGVHHGDTVQNWLSNSGRCKRQMLKKMRTHMAIGQNLWYHIWVDEHPFTSYFDVHQGYRVLTHCHIFEAVPFNHPFIDGTSKKKTIRITAYPCLWVSPHVDLRCD